MEGRFILPEGEGLVVHAPINLDGATVLLDGNAVSWSRLKTDGPNDLTIPNSVLDGVKVIEIRKGNDFCKLTRK